MESPHMCRSNSGCSIYELDCVDLSSLVLWLEEYGIWSQFIPLRNGLFSEQYKYIYIYIYIHIHITYIIHIIIVYSKWNYQYTYIYIYIHSMHISAFRLITWWWLWLRSCVASKPPCAALLRRAEDRRCDQWRRPHHVPGLLRWEISGGSWWEIRYRKTMGFSHGKTMGKPRKS